ncbi:hypothetical protein CA51_50810 [Rosistilla oblonga]|uniref:peptidase C39 n=1 Tax=Rosistilla oblonga TaxID=2527990 RepID=UPI00118B46DD|nr:peptidase C39 [Rosistilla oblonga]QDV15169.1 hypothetical protein CA51_50810 [Rosistilla oblonga]
MTDIFTAIGIVLVVSLTLGLLVARSPQPSGVWRTAAMAILLIGAFGNVFYSTGLIVWARYIPHSAVIVWANVVPIAAAISAGLAYRLPNTPHWRQLLASGLLGLLSFGTVFWPLQGFILRPPQPGGNTWSQGVALQTSWSSCSPAAAATLLRANGVDVDESDLMTACLTDNRGTVSLGLYRGVKLFADANDLEVEIVPPSLDQLIIDDQWPVLLMVRLPKTGVEDPRYEHNWGWIPGLGHSVVCFGRLPNGNFIVGDPSIGREQWTTEDMKILWHGDGIRLHKRGEPFDANAPKH